MDKVIIVGAGGHAKVIADIILQNGEYEIAGLIDRKSVKGFWNIPVIGDDTELSEIRKRGIKYAFIALGANQLRRKLSELVKNEGFQLINVISRHAVISNRVSLATGIAIMPGAIINADTRIGEGGIINTNASIDHEGCLESYVHIAPGCSISGKVKIGENSFIGTGSRIIDGITIGADVVAGAGSVIIKDVESACTIVGVPAKKIK